MFKEDFYLENETGKTLYNKYAKDLPIIDYHCHLLSEEIYENKVFSDIGEMWLAHDHYKWRAMRTFGIDEEYITGNKSFKEKFIAFADIMPYLIGNPIYIWCALELKRYFEIDEPLGPENAEKIYEITKSKIERENITPKYLIEKSNVEYISTTDDPIDDLNYHIKFQEDSKFNTKIVPAFRPDKALYVENNDYLNYISHLGNVTEININSFSELINSLEKRLVFFKSVGSVINDNGITEFNFVDYNNQEIEDIFKKVLNNEKLSLLEIDIYKTAFLIEMSKLYHKHGFVMQLHVGTYKDANSKMYKEIGANTGYDCTGDLISVKSIGKFLDHLNNLNCLPKTILYPLDMNQYESFAILAAAFCGGGVKAKVQLGAPWWFNDQAYGIKKQFESVASLYPISLSVGMLTDSRSFLSYPRHELYRRVFCNYLGELIEKGEYFSKEKYLKEVIENVCYKNAKEYFGL